MFLSKAVLLIWYPLDNWPWCYVFLKGEFLTGGHLHLRHHTKQHLIAKYSGHLVIGQHLAFASAFVENDLCWASGDIYILGITRNKLYRLLHVIISVRFFHFCLGFGMIWRLMPRLYHISGTLVHDEMPLYIYLNSNLCMSEVSFSLILVASCMRHVRFDM